MRVLVPGGSGHVGAALQRSLGALGHDVVVLSRNPKPGQTFWDGKNLGSWTEELESADVVVNLAGRSVNCRYNASNLKAMMDSRVESTRILRQAIERAKHPPAVWLQASTATIYAHRFDAPNDDETGIIGGNEPGTPAKWAASIEIAKAWERELFDGNLPRTRRVALRSAMTMTSDKGSVFDVMASMARKGLGGAFGNGRQFVSWIHGEDFVRAVLFLTEQSSIAGTVNVCSPNPLPNREFNAILRKALGVRFGLPAPAWLLECGALLLGTETELILKSRRVVPSRLLREGFEFHFPKWPEAAGDLASAR